MDHTLFLEKKTLKMSNEREKEKEKNNEVESIDHICHGHPLALTESEESGRCIGCTRSIRSGQTIYACRQGCSYPTLHVQCAEMPREIKLSIHPQHTLILRKLFYSARCTVCGSYVYLGYSCASADECEFQVHVWCVHDMEVLPSCIDHASHPRHQLTLLWRPGSLCSSRCDACGTIEKGNFYMCMVCQYWIHDSCANLSAVAHYKHHHHHSLSLIYHLPIEYIKYNFTCDICFEDLVPRYWAYHCETCRYVVHIKCAIKTTTINVEADAVEEEEEEVITFPVNNAVEELIGSFIAKAGGVIANPNEIVNRKYKFHNHEHQLRLMEEEEDESSDEDDFNYRDSKLVCDGCTLPIFPRKQENYCKYYMSCGECKYFLHWSCFNLPFEIPSHPLHPCPNHNLTLRTCPKIDICYCRICYIQTNGLFYECTKCEFVIDVKCVSLPNTIKHKAHPRHYLKLDTSETARNMMRFSACYACRDYPYLDTIYICDVCKVFFHASCVLLPAVITNRGWDKHPLPLTFDASVDHPSSFCCDICELEMNPKLWMYHCRICDFSAHPKCFPTASGNYRNIKFGQRYVVASVHDHPIAYQLLTKNSYCDVCGKRKAYGSEGFQCVSDKCEFFMCFYMCSIDHRAEMKLVIEEASSSYH